MKLVLFVLCVAGTILLQIEALLLYPFIVLSRKKVAKIDPAEFDAFVFSRQRVVVQFVPPCLSYFGPGLFASINFETFARAQVGDVEFATCVSRSSESVPSHASSISPLVLRFEHGKVHSDFVGMASHADLQSLLVAKGRVGVPVGRG
eukprot:TRINITY_DN19391_c0_g1_i1.p1 TRINITY_DN19391_c0_g1~~TRINITY_DN19391_c0_g1_i1.p1  ORF type:complete len:148 (+),score=21.23 TRINITY_DN19391_c0_g1_i1:167-610(+)